MSANRIRLLHAAVTRSSRSGAILDFHSQRILLHGGPSASRFFCILRPFPVMPHHFSSPLARIAYAIACLLLMVGAETLRAQDASSSLAQNAVEQTPPPGALQRGQPEEESRAGKDNPDRQLYYVAGEPVMLYNTPDSTRPVRRLEVTTPVHRLGCASDWCQVRTDDGKTGYLPESAISNVWIRASKTNRRVYLYRGTHLLETFKADFGYNAFSDKERRGSLRLRDHWRSPAGDNVAVHGFETAHLHQAAIGGAVWSARTWAGVR